MTSSENITNERFGKLIAVDINPEITSQKHRSYWNCLCDCGGKTVANISSLRNGRKSSCGCIAGWRSVVLDLSGQKFNRLQAIEYNSLLSNDKNKRLWDFQCDCGRIIAQEPYRVKAGYVKSCGCLNADQRKARAKESGVSASNQLYATYKRGAKVRNIPFHLTQLEFITIANNLCVYCETPPKEFYGTATTPIITNGVDRIDSDQGYSMDNCVACCEMCNVMKNRWTKEQFLQQVEKIYGVYKRY